MAQGTVRAADDVDYYRSRARKMEPKFVLSDPLVKTLTVINPHWLDHVHPNQLGPQTIGGVQNLYQLNKTGYWSQQDLRMIWNTGGRNGRYRLDCKAQTDGAGRVAIVSLLLTPTIMPPCARQLAHGGRDQPVLYANNDPIVECGDITFRTPTPRS